MQPPSSLHIAPFQHIEDHIGGILLVVAGIIARFVLRIGLFQQWHRQRRVRLVDMDADDGTARTTAVALVEFVLARGLLVVVVKGQGLLLLLSLLHAAVLVQQVAHNARQADRQTDHIYQAQLILFKSHGQGQLADVLEDPSYREGKAGGLAQHQKLAELHEEGQQSAKRDPGNGPGDLIRGVIVQILQHLHQLDTCRDRVL